jgi:colanic acid/amylovoran biosynthesis glycosyltransferase
VHLIAQAAKALAVRSPVIWHHFGPGMTPEVQAELDAPRPEGLSIEMHGLMPQHAVQEFFRCTDISFFINLSASEGVPVSIMEALNADLPVVAPAINGVPEIVLNGRAGCLIPTEMAVRPAEVAALVWAELQRGGRLATSRPREVWEERWQADKNALAVAQRLRLLAIERYAQAHPVT